MKILSFESTCDETAVAVVEDGRKLLTDQIFSQADLHAVYGANQCSVKPFGGKLNAESSVLNA